MTIKCRIIKTRHWLKLNVVKDLTMIEYSKCQKCRKISYFFLYIFPSFYFFSCIIFSLKSTFSTLKE